MGGGGGGIFIEIFVKGDVLNREKFELLMEILPFFEKIVQRFLKVFAN